MPEKNLAAAIFIAGLCVLLLVGGLFLWRRADSPTPSLLPPAVEPAQEVGLAPNSPPANINQKETPSMNKPQINPQVTLRTTVGDITIELFNNQTPKTAENFLSLAQKGFYNQTIFHRTIAGFMIQGGDPKGDGTGGPGYTFDDEPFAGSYTRGTVAMANRGPNTNGSQFFIMHQEYPLPPNYVIFGRVVAGLEVVDKIASAPVTSNQGGEQSKPVQPVSITSVIIK